jgi:hypothetical protein
MVIYLSVSGYFVFKALFGVWIPDYNEYDGTWLITKLHKYFITMFAVWYSIQAIPHMSIQACATHYIARHCKRMYRARYSLGHSWYGHMHLLMTVITALANRLRCQDKAPC